MNVREIRRANLSGLVREYCGTQRGSIAAFARAIDRPSAMVSSLLYGRRGLGNELARHVERKVGLPENTLDKAYYWFPDDDGDDPDGAPPHARVMPGAGEHSKDTVGWGFGDLGASDEPRPENERLQPAEAPPDWVATTNGELELLRAWRKAPAILRRAAMASLNSTDTTPEDPDLTPEQLDEKAPPDKVLKPLGMKPTDPDDPSYQDYEKGVSKTQAASRQSGTTLKVGTDRRGDKQQPDFWDEPSQEPGDEL